MSERWVVDVIHYHPRFGDFYAVHNERDGRYELINRNGSDGGIEVLA